MPIDTSRHKELFDPHYFDKPVTIIGAGATGSWLALALAKLGITDITVYDFDIVEEHNIANQKYGIPNIGFSKVTALQSDIKQDTQTMIKIHNTAFTNQRLAGIVFLMVDTMSCRKEIWENSIKMKTAVDLLIEPRMGLDIGRIYNVNPCDTVHIKEYEETYYDDDVAEVSACGASKTVISTAYGITSWCTRQLINFNADVDLDNEILIDFKYNNIITRRWE